jgi:hypothetical protein
VTDELAARLRDDDAHVRGRAAEALGVFVRGASDDGSLPEATLDDVCEDEAEFASDRAQFALASIEDGTTASDEADDIGTLDGMRQTTGDALEAITTPDADGECRHCGLTLPEGGPPMCPRCGAPR